VPRAPTGMLRTLFNSSEVSSTVFNRVIFFFDYIIVTTLRMRLSASLALPVHLCHVITLLKRGR
jgi:hypothetical protein